MAGNSTVDDPYKTDWAQPAFDSRINSFPMLSPNGMAYGPTLQRGYIKQAQGNQAGAIGQTTSPSGFLTAPRTVRFLYNPSSISVSHSISTGDAAADPANRAVTDTGRVIGSTGATLSFSLLFDRTYEVSNPANFGTQLGEQGVAVDVNAMYALTGILQLQSVNPVPLTPTAPTPQQNQANNQSKAEAIAQQVVREDKATNFTGVDPNNITQATLAALGAADDQAERQVATDITKKLLAAGLSTSDLPATATSGSSPTGAGTSPQYPPGWPFVSGYPSDTQAFGYMTAQPVIIVFGIQRQTWNPCLQYYGYVNSLGVEYAHWTQNMVPTRCAISIGVNLYPSTVDQMTQAALWTGPS